MRIPARRLSALVAVATLTVAGCGGSAEDGAQPSGSQTTSASPTQESTPDDSAGPTQESTPDDDGSAAETEDDAVEIEVEIENGRVTPSGERLDVEVGRTIRLVVDSDAADEIHVHSTPEHSFRVRPGMDDKEFRFRLTQPGVVEMELHEQGDVIATLAARP
jgi:hypothetical protein